jgi:aryl-alcohol dehydrogenase-like predicted oxidoreductase
VTLLAYSPLEQGLLTGKYVPASLPSDGRAEAAWFSAQNVAAAEPVVTKLRSIASARAVDAAAIAIAWLLAKPGVVPLAGAKTGEQALGNAKALSIELSETEVAELDAVSEPWRTAGS